MKIYIGPYKNWVGPYQIADLLQYVKVSEDTCYSVGKWLSTTFLNDICEWIHSKKSRKIKLKIHNYDVWNMDDTLAIIIYPMLQKLKEEKHGAPFVDDEDVPENIRKTSAKPTENEWDTDEFFFDRWDYVLNEMIWAFSQILDESECPDGYKDEYRAYENRINNGTRLFGKYYRSLWD